MNSIVLGSGSCQGAFAFVAHLALAFFGGEGVAGEFVMMMEVVVMMMIMIMIMMIMMMMKTSHHSYREH